MKYILSISKQQVIINHKNEKKFKIKEMKKIKRMSGNTQ